MFLYWCGGFKLYEILPVVLSSFPAILKHVCIVRPQLMASFSGIRKSHATSWYDWRLNPCWKTVFILCLWYCSSCCKWYPWNYVHISQLIFVMHWISLSVTSWLTFWSLISKVWKVHMLFLWTNYLELHHRKKLHTDPGNIVAVALGWFTRHSLCSPHYFLMCAGILSCFGWFLLDLVLCHFCIPFKNLFWRVLGIADEIFQNLS